MRDLKVGDWIQFDFYGHILEGTITSVDVDGYWSVAGGSAYKKASFDKIIKYVVL